MSATTVPAAAPDPATLRHAPPPENLRVRARAAWTLYDFANTIFSFAIVSGAMGLWLTKDAQLGEGPGQLAFSIAVAVSVGINAIVSPILGALSDRGGQRLPFLLAFTALCIGPTAVIAIDGPLLGLVLFTIANFSYQAALIYYDASIKLVSTPETRGRVSGIGVGIGYCGTVFVGLLIFLLEVPVELRFPLSALLFGLFAIPVFLVVKDPRDPHAARVTVGDFFRSWDQLRTTIAHAREVPGLGRFLLGRFFYSDAVNTIIVVMSVVAVEAVGFTDNQAVLILLTLTLVAIVMSFVWGWLADRMASRVPVLVGVGITAVAVALLVLPPTTPLLVLAGILTGGGASIVITPLLLELSRRSDDSDRGTAFSLFSAALAAALVIGSIGVAPLVAAAGFEAALAGTLLGLGLAAVVTIRDRGFAVRPSGA